MTEVPVSHTKKRFHVNTNTVKGRIFGRYRGGNGKCQFTCMHWIFTMQKVGNEKVIVEDFMWIECVWDGDWYTYSKSINLSFKKRRECELQGVERSEKTIIRKGGRNGSEWVRRVRIWH